jgi:hypothetical protein
MKQVARVMFWRNYLSAILEVFSKYDYRCIFSMTRRTNILVELSSGMRGSLNGGLAFIVLGFGHRIHRTLLHKTSGMEFHENPVKLYYRKIS